MNRQPDDQGSLDDGQNVDHGLKASLVTGAVRTAVVTNSRISEERSSANVRSASHSLSVAMIRTTLSLRVSI